MVTLASSKFFIELLSIFLYSTTICKQSFLLEQLFGTCLSAVPHCVPFLASLLIVISFFSFSLNRINTFINPLFVSSCFRLASVSVTFGHTPNASVIYFLLILQFILQYFEPLGCIWRYIPPPSDILTVFVESLAFRIACLIDRSVSLRFAYISFHVFKLR